MCIVLAFVELLAGALHQILAAEESLEDQELQLVT